MLDGKEIDFMGVRKIAGVISAVLAVIAVISLVVNSLQFGLDFSCSKLRMVRVSSRCWILEKSDDFSNIGFLSC